MAADRDHHPTTPARDTDLLIARLAADARPVRRLPSPAARVGLWLALALGVLLVACATLGARPDLAASLGTVSFAAPLLLLVAAGVASGAMALLASVPGREPARATALGTLAVVLVALAGELRERAVARAGLPSGGGPGLALRRAHRAGRRRCRGWC